MNDHQSRRPLSLPFLIASALALMAAFFAPASLEAQGIPPAVAAPLVASYGLDTNNFMIAGYPTKWPDPGQDVSKVWLFSRSLGLDVIFVGGGDLQIDDMVHSEDKQDHERIVLLSPKGSKQVQAGYGREVEFFAFDTVPSPFFYCLFYDKDSGVVQSNSSGDPESFGKTEKRYSISNTIPGQMILSTPIYRYDSLKHIYPIPRGLNDTAARDMGHFLEATQHHHDHVGYGRTFYFATNAHLTSQSGSVPDTATILRLEIWHEIPKDFSYLDNSHLPVTAVADTTILCDTFLISKGELMAGIDSIDLQAFRQIVRGSDLRTRRIDGGPGPMDSTQPKNRSYRLDIRAFWLGGENVAVRSIAIRDSIGELVLGTTPASANYRDNVVLPVWERMLYGNTLHPDSLRQSIIRIETGVEADFSPTEYAGFERINQLLRNKFNLVHYRQSRSEPLRPGDSLTAWQINFAPENFHNFATPPEVMFEIGFNAKDDTSSFPGKDGKEIREYSDTNLLPHNRYEVPHDKIPAIKQHNGGRGQLPLLMDLDSLGISAHDLSLKPRIEAYESVLQRTMYGHYNPGRTYVHPNEVFEAATNGYGRAAAISRRTGRRFVSQIGTVNRFSLRARPEGDSAVTDTIIGHIPERSELRGLVNLSLAYGARGILWWGLGSNHSVMYKRTVNGTDIWVNEDDDNQCCFGSNGYFQDDTTANVLDLVLNEGSIMRALIPNFYIGYADRTREVKEMDLYWLKRIGPELMKLRWRNGYSVHYMTPWVGSVNDPHFRPVDTNEIFSSVTSRHPFSSTPDSAHRTFVEIGLFDKKIGYDTIDTGSGPDISVDPMLDTNYMYVVNRRSFEPPIDTVLNLLDTLAESRTISIKFQMTHPDQTQYNFIRVREVMPDTIHLPYTWASRNGLDTTVSVDSAVSITLRPAGGALLEITYCPPDTNIIDGDLQTNNQRKLLYFHDRYHMVFWRKSPGPPAKDTVLYRRSLRTSECCGSILWEPKEYAVSLNPMGNFTNDCYPSLTARTFSGDTIVTVVWTNRNLASPIPDRYVWMRNILVNEGEPQFGSRIMLGRHKGIDPSQWGTPVVSSVHGGDIVAWSDSSVGIVAVVRKLNTGSNGWAQNGQISTPDTASLYDPSYGGGGFDMFPTMPAFSHLRSLDSNVGMAWQRIFPVSEPPISGIMYMRLEHADSTLTGRDSLINHNYTWLSTTSERAFHPSMDMAQGVWNNVYEGVTWESLEPATSGLGGWDTWLNFRSLWTPTNERSGWDRIDPTWLWGLAQLRVTEDQTWSASYPYLLPNTSSNNAVYEMPADSADSLMFSVAYLDPAGGMRQAKIRFSDVNFQNDAPLSYSFGGIHPNGSAAPFRQPDRHAVIYESSEPAGKIIRSTRQFFPKMRPQDYMADGRRVALLLDTLARTGISIMLHDPWKSDPSGGNAITMIDRGFQDSGPVENLSQMTSLMRTGYFHAYDSTVLGLELAGHYFGDRELAPDAEVKVIAELVDSATSTVLQQLDSFALTLASPVYGTRLEPTLDLLSGTYYVRLRIDTSGFTKEMEQGEIRYSLAELASEVRAEVASKLRRVERSADAGRISARPNPANKSAEIRFSVPVNATASLRLYDGGGRQVLQPMESGQVEAGRYALLTDLSSVPAGTYLLELQYTTGTRIHRVVEKMIITR